MSLSIDKAIDSISHTSKILLRKLPYLIIALCAPVLHVVSWQNAVRAVSGEETFDEVTLDLTAISLSGSIGSEGEDTDGATKHASAFMGALGW